MNSTKLKREHLLQQMNQIQTMEYGSLQAEVRPKTAASKGEPVGPYYKHQAWENGRNVSCRIPTAQAPALATAIAGRQQFEKLAQEFVAVTVAETRRPLNPAKKKSRRKSAKPKTSKGRPSSSSL